MEKKKFVVKITELLEKKKKKNFKQSVEVCVNFKDVQMEKPEYKLKLDVMLPKGRGKDLPIGIFADGDTALQAKELTGYVLGKEDILEYAKSKRKMRNYANSCHKFLAQPDLMPVIGRSWGIVLGPRAKMPQPLPPKVPIEPIIERLRKTITITSKKNPTVHAPIGTEDMSIEDLAENAMAVMSAIKRQITEDKIRSVYVKTTMGEVLMVEQ
ncbi:50S ribosomal protein L1 [Candidatus Altiarchaeales archaeon WOR_SM1_SCG]|nr:50S ribosomal protein L1 [Candidatus Altiarchaeales archaeon WOR_SM1_SCG]